jgi:hypothetical protein
MQMFRVGKSAACSILRARTEAALYEVPAKTGCGNAIFRALDRRYLSRAYSDELLRSATANLSGPLLTTVNRWRTG